MRPPTLLGPKSVSVALAAVLLAGGVAAAVVRPAAPPAPEVLAVDVAVPFPAASPAPLPSPAAPAAAPVKAVPAVAPLADLRAADLVVTLPTSITPAQAKALQGLEAVEAVTLVDAGTVKVGGKGARVVGVDPSAFRAFTPQETAASDALWQVVARGELAPSYALQRSRGLQLGGSVLVDGTADVQGRVGAVASYGLPGVDLVTDQATARTLGVVPDSAVLVSAPDRGITALQAAVREVLGPDAKVEVLRAQVAQVANRGKATSYKDLYVSGAKTCPGLSWTVLAAIGQVESAHGKHLGPSSAGALGPMQFLPSTWAAYGVDGDGDGKADIMSPYDAIPSAAGYLCRFGASRGPDGLYDAIFAYNHADWYVRKVLGVADAYAKQG